MVHASMRLGRVVVGCLDSGVRAVLHALRDVPCIADMSDILLI